MKSIITIVLIFWTSGIFAQDTNRTDSLYYLLDTAAIPKMERMWQSGIDGPFKYFTIECPCMRNGRKPTFYYRTDVKGEIIDEKLRTIKLISLKTLIEVSKMSEAANMLKQNILFFIEPVGGSSLMHKVAIVPYQNREKSIDIITVPPLHPAKRKVNN